MCIVIDANCLGRFLANPPDIDSEPVHLWLRRSRGKLVYSASGKFSEEISVRARQRLLEYVQGGLADEIPAECFATQEKEFEQSGEMHSDDPHVLALASYAGVRLLFTEDQDLVKDFKKKRFIDKPRGKIYSGVENRSLLTQDACKKRV